MKASNKMTARRAITASGDKKITKTTQVNGKKLNKKKARNKTGSKGIDPIPDNEDDPRWQSASPCIPISKSCSLTTDFSRTPLTLFVPLEPHLEVADITVVITPGSPALIWYNDKKGKRHDVPIIVLEMRRTKSGMLAFTYLWCKKTKNGYWTVLGRGLDDVRIINKLVEDDTVVHVTQEVREELNRLRTADYKSLPQYCPETEKLYEEKLEIGIPCAMLKLVSINAPSGNLELASTSDAATRDLQRAKRPQGTRTDAHTGRPLCQATNTGPCAAAQYPDRIVTMEFAQDADHDPQPEVQVNGVVASNPVREEQSAVDNQTSDRGTHARVSAAATVEIQSSSLIRHAPDGEDINMADHAATGTSGTHELGRMQELKDLTTPPQTDIQRLLEASYRHSDLYGSLVADDKDIARNSINMYLDHPIDRATLYQVTENTARNGDAQTEFLKESQPFSAILQVNPGLLIGICASALEKMTMDLKSATMFDEHVKQMQPTIHNTLSCLSPYVVRVALCKAKTLAETGQILQLPMWQAYLSLSSEEQRNLQAQLPWLSTPSASSQSRLVDDATYTTPDRSSTALGKSVPYAINQTPDDMDSHNLLVDDFDAMDSWEKDFDAMGFWEKNFDAIGLWEEDIDAMEIPLD